jgi:hypothetical protein
MNGALPGHTITHMFIFYHREHRGRTENTEKVIKHYFFQLKTGNA